MKTYLFTWNPKKWQWTNLSEAIIETNSTGKYFDIWSCGVNKSIKKGDRIFLIKLGENPKGIIGSGFSISNVFQTAHWDDNLAAQGKQANRIEIEFDTLSENPIITIDELKESFSENQTWLPQASGIQINKEIVFELEKLWSKKTLSILPENIQDISNLYLEGKRIQKLSYFYERNSEAREKCILHYGYSCQVCGIDFKQKYGEIGKNFIHVHHKKPLSEINQEYLIDPIIDLIPVCPNCHSMIHRTVPALKIEELKNRMPR